jgi:hypothetical protein
MQKHYVHTHFCSKCGKALQQINCKKEKRFGFVWRLLCPNCGAKVENSGGMLFILGLAVIILGGFSMAFENEGFVVGCGLCVIGVMRLIRQFRTAKSVRAA